MDALKKVPSGVEGEESGDNGERQDDKQQAEEQPGNEEFPCAIGVAAEAEDEEKQGKLNREKAVAEKPEETVERNGHEMVKRLPAREKERRRDDGYRPTRPDRPISLCPAVTTKS